MHKADLRKESASQALLPRYMTVCKMVNMIGRGRPDAKVIYDKMVELNELYNLHS